MSARAILLVRSLTARLDGESGYLADLLAPADGTGCLRSGVRAQRVAPLPCVM